MDEREHRAERATELAPWAAVGWPGYSRGVHLHLNDARRAELQGNGDAAEYWLAEAERYASHACKWDAVVYQSVETYRKAWERHSSSPAFRPFVWPNRAGHPDK